jgi:hypothetical protein
MYKLYKSELKIHVFFSYIKWLNGFDRVSAIDIRKWKNGATKKPS